MNRAQLTPSLKSYFKSIQEYQPLSREEELELAIAIQSGCRESVNRLVNHNLKIVVKIAYKNLNRGIDLEDLIQSGNIGLHEAALRFNPADIRGRFIGFAQTRILKNINQLIDQCGRTVRIPVNQEYQRYLDLKEGKEVENIRPVYLDAFLGEDNKNTVGSRIVQGLEDSSTALEQAEEQEAIQRYLSILTPQEREVISYFFGLEEDPITQKEIAEMMGTSGATISYLKNGALEKIRKHIGIQVTK
jgi:RNA polymerase primary sigma factor